MLWRFWCGRAKKIRMEADFFGKRKKFSVFKIIRIRVDEATKKGIYKKVMRRGVGVSALPVCFWVRYVTLFRLS